jgi:hypothetical protein
MIIIEIESTAIKSKNGTNEKTGKDWLMNFQQISITGHYVDGFPSRHPRESTIQLDEKNPVPFPVGAYVLSPESFYFGDFGRFTLGRMKLQPLKEYLADMQKQLGCSIAFNQPKAA